MSKDALIIGINTYKFLPSLKSPSQDAEALAQLLETYGEFTVRRLPEVKKDNTVQVGQETSVTLEQLENELIQRFHPEGKNIPDTVLLFFSGHGLRKDKGGIQEGFLAASDTNIKTGNWGLSLRWLRELFQKSQVRQQIICLDCCHSGELFNFDEAYPGDKSNARDLSFITASREFELAYEEISGRHGVLTDALLKGLDPTQQADGEVSNLWLSDFIAKKLKQGNAFQKPVFRNSGHPIVLTRCFKPPEPAPQISASAVCPYKGLAYFDCNEADHKYFFGRTALTDQLLEKVREGNFVAVLGASGSGKSSVVRAGLLWQLKLRQRLSGSGQWEIRIFQPGEDPLRSLAFAFLEEDAEFAKAKEAVGKGPEGFGKFVAETAGSGRLIIVADQFEEVFTLCREYTERQQFFETLFGGLKFAGNRICLIVAMRSDFFGKCSEREYAGLADQIQSHLLTVIPMTSEELKLAIEEPAKLAGLGIEAELITQMTDDVKDSPGSLPLLQYALTELWKQRTSDGLKLADYVRLGRVKGTLSKRADEIYKALSPEEQEIAKRIFIELTRLGEGTEDTRRRVSTQRLISSEGSEETISRVIQKLADEKLIVTSETIPPFCKGGSGGISEKGGVVDVAHEALIRHWGLLRKWLDENRDDIRFHRRLEDAATYWDENQRPEGLLWRSPDLDMLQGFHKRKQGEIRPLEREFFRESVNARERDIAEKKAARQRELEQAKALAGEQRKRAEERDEAARNLESLLAKNYWFNAAKAMEEGDWLKTAHFSAKATTKQPDHLQIKNYILNIHDHISNCFIVYQVKHESFVSGALFNKDETQILTWSNDGTARVWNASDGKPLIEPMKHEDSVGGAVFSKDESRILTWSGSILFFNVVKEGIVCVWNASDGKPIIELMKHEGSVNGSCFNADESRILTWSSDGTARVWNASDGKPLSEPMKHGGSVNGSVFSADESRILTWSGDGTARVWNISIRKKPYRIDKT